MKAGTRDAAGVLGAILAALCCAGTPFIVAGLAALGLGFLRHDGILLLAMVFALAVALSGFWKGARSHGDSRLFAIGALGTASLVVGVLFVHGFPAIQLIYGGAAALVVGAVWNAMARRSCERAGLRGSA